jgi:23S rRNA pseudouridine1911/1915/1917 synthase
VKTLNLHADRAAERLDVFLARSRPELSRSHARRLIDQGMVTVDGHVAKPSQQLTAGALVVASIPPPEPLELSPEDIPITVVYQDADIIVVDKPPGLTVHPAPGHPHGTLVNALLAICTDLRGIAGTLRPGIVHRLDKDTSGLLVVAKNDRAQRGLSLQIKERRVRKVYLALVHGVPRSPEGLIDAPIGRHLKHRKKMAVIPAGRSAETRYRIRERLSNSHRYTLLQVEPITGRTHQIRVHLAAIGHPVVGDAVYGKRSPLIARQALHAWRLAFSLPSDGRTVEFEAPLPRDISMAIAEIGSGA